MRDGHRDVDLRPAQVPVRHRGVELVEHVVDDPSNHPAFDLVGVVEAVVVDVAPHVHGDARPVGASELGLLALERIEKTPEVILKRHHFQLRMEE